jgi:two-component system NarL family sensor kinase
VIHAGAGLGQLESSEPVRGYALIRVEFVLTGLVAAALLDFKGDGLLALLLGAIFLPIAVAILVLAQRMPTVALNPLAALADLVSLSLILALVPASWAAIHFCGLVLALVYPLVRGERHGVVFAVALVATLVPITLVVDAPPPHNRLLFYELVFAVATISGALFAGRMARSQAIARLRARELTRRTIEAGYEARREVAQSLHDGPVQELVSADMKIEGALNASARGDQERTRELLHDVRALVERNITALRNELIALGPMAFDELTFQEAVERCTPAWQRRYDIDVRTDLVRLDMPNEVCGALFGIAQEAVANAGRHAGAACVDLSLRATDGIVELCIRDDGKGFGDVSPLGALEPGHLGLASMRERAAIAGGELAIRSTGKGTEVLVRLPAAALS